MRVLATGSLTLEPQVAAHADEMFAVLSDPAIYEYENQPPPSLEWLRNRYGKLETRLSPDGQQQWLNWVIRLPSSQLIGYVQATVGPGDRAAIAYELASAYWGRGLAREAVDAVLTELSEHYAMRFFFAVLKRENRRSERMLQRLGFAVATTEQHAAQRIPPDEVLMCAGRRTTQTHFGSCHCGAVTFEIDTDFPELTRCDCSICRRKNALMVKVHESSFRLLSGADSLTEYRFHTMTARHFFCRTCGIYPFHRKRVTPDYLGINVFCLRDFDPSGIRVRQAVGAAMK